MGETGQNRENKPGHDSNGKTAASGGPWTEMLGQDSWGKIARKGNRDVTVHPGEKTEDKTATTGHQGQDSQEWTSGWDHCDRTIGIGYLGQRHWDRTV
jgi:hypothetical protein